VKVQSKQVFKLVPHFKLLLFEKFNPDPLNGNASSMKWRNKAIKKLDKIIENR